MHQQPNRCNNNTKVQPWLEPSNAQRPVLRPTRWRRPVNQSADHAVNQMAHAHTYAYIYRYIDVVIVTRYVVARKLQQPYAIDTERDQWIKSSHREACSAERGDVMRSLSSRLLTAISKQAYVFFFTIHGGVVCCNNSAAALMRDAIIERCCSGSNDKNKMFYVHTYMCTCVCIYVCIYILYIPQSCMWLRLACVCMAQTERCAARVKRSASLPKRCKWSVARTYLVGGCC